jgi:hypothetical protein
MSETELVVFECPEGHRIEKQASEITDGKYMCQKCGAIYRFRHIDLEPVPLAKLSTD